MKKLLIALVTLTISCSKNSSTTTSCSTFNSNLFIGKTYKISKIVNRENNIDITTEYQNSFPCTKYSLYQFITDKCIVVQNSSTPCFPGQNTNFETNFTTQTQGSINYLTYSTYTDTVLNFDCDNFTVVRKSWKQNGPTIYTPVVTFTKQ
jgi:hypothetical protein